jgi:hypothetical protein
VFGDASSWPSLQEQLPHIQQTTPGLTFYGKVPQTRIAEEFRTAGCLVFPSLSFESAGLSVLDAQASGCPVIASDIGGVREYLIPECGVLVEKLDGEKLQQALLDLLISPERMEQMCREGEQRARYRTWSVVADELLALARQPVPSLAIPTCRTVKQIEEDPLRVIQQHDALYRTWFKTGFSYQQLLDDHEHIASGTVLDDEVLFQLQHAQAEYGIIAFWKGLRFETLGKNEDAHTYYSLAHESLGGKRMAERIPTCALSRQSR